ncbi:hypothetical protein [Pseudobacillus badius]|uniref:hypothetical protein n=1 Tax=Bacillus badius TaxID=1455 RepID=UPI001CBD3CFE|nr:hypothetical protein [Bacillus badius]UAT28960.1 hypothetical protein K7T73_09985 [Bacillus badius]GLY12970.1 hypothetical protein Bbad01_41860 [Bacillus badius]
MKNIKATSSLRIPSMNNCLISLSISYNFEPLLLYKIEDGYILKCFTNNEWEDIYIPLKDEVHLVQKMTLGRVLVVKSFAESKNEKNAFVFDRKGKYLYSFFAGSGISNAQVTEKDLIWLVYHDEGVFSGELVGEDGIIGLNDLGEIVYNQFDKFVFNNQTSQILDCYAMNSPTSEDIWLYYYDEFPIVKFNKNKNELTQITTNNSDLTRDTKGFAISGNFLLFVCDLRNHFQIFSIFEKRVIIELTPVDGAGEIIQWGDYTARGSEILLYNKEYIYRFSFFSILRELGIK